MDAVEKELTRLILTAAEKVTDRAGERESFGFYFWLKKLKQRQLALKKYRDEKTNQRHIVS